jgi:hypothetical protein
VISEIKLNTKKEELFTTANFIKWDMTPEDFEKLDKDELIANKEFAFSKMLAKETNYCCSLKRNYGYHLNTLISEYKRYQKNLAKRYKKHFLNLSSRHTILLSDIFSMVKLLTCSS